MSSHGMTHNEGFLGSGSMRMQDSARLSVSSLAFIYHLCTA